MTTTTNPLHGLTAKQLREALTNNTTTQQEVIDHLTARKKADKLRVPSAKLLEELSGKPAITKKRATKGLKTAKATTDKAKANAKLAEMSDDDIRNALMALLI